jgi:hypothetical protein
MVVNSLIATSRGCMPWLGCVRGVRRRSARGSLLEADGWLATTEARLKEDTR